MSAMSKATSAINTKSVQDAIKNLTRFVKKLDTVPTAELSKSAETMKAEMVAQAQHPVKGKAHYISDPFNSEVGKLKVRLREELKVTDDS